MGLPHNRRRPGLRVYLGCSTHRLTRGCKRLYNDGCKISREASSGLGVGDTDGGALGPVVVEPDTNSGIEGYCNPYT